jgi:23S rRNA pseudouridine2605 synthase
MKRSPTTATNGERLQKILSQAGVSSRRAAEEMIRTGRVTVNGKTITELGTKANPWTDRIAVDGRPLRQQAPPVYILLHKPVGVVTTLDDPQERPTVRDLLKGVRTRVFPVGRLDFHSAGLLLLTNDGALALRLTHPRYGVHKTYQVKVKGDPQPNQLATLASGVRLADGETNPSHVHVMRRRDQKAWLSITLAEGKNRQVRRMCEAVGLPVEKLVRVAFGGLKLGGLASGQWRHLEPEEVALLHRPQAMARPRSSAPPRSRGHQRRPGDDRARGQRPDRRRVGGGEGRSERADRRHGAGLDPRRRDDRARPRGVVPERRGERPDRRDETRSERRPSTGFDPRRRDDRARPRAGGPAPRRAPRAAAPGRPSPRPRRASGASSGRPEFEPRSSPAQGADKRRGAPAAGRPPRRRPSGPPRPRAADSRRPDGPPRGRRR